MITQIDKIYKSIHLHIEYFYLLIMHVFYASCYHFVVLYYSMRSKKDHLLFTIPDTLFFQPTFPFSDYCLKRGKAQSAKG